MSGGHSQKELASAIAAFDEKLRMLIKTHDRLLWDLNKLKKKNESLVIENQQLIKEYQELKKNHSLLFRDFNGFRIFAKIETKKLKITGGISGLKEDIDHYINNIDAVIAKLKQ